MLSTFYRYINDNYGSKRGLYNALKYGAITQVGGYSNYADIDFTKVSRVIFICSGNICRSPLGEYAARFYGINAESYGLHCRGGDGADPRAVEFASSIGIDMSGHITRNIKHYSPLPSDLVVGMEPRHLKELNLYVNGSVQKTVAPLWASQRNVYLHDPYNTNKAFFEKCESTIFAASAELAKKIKGSQI